MGTEINEPTELGNLLKAARKAQGLSQEQLGAAIGLSQKRMSVLERRPEVITVEQLLKLSKALSVSLILSSPANS